MTGYDFVKNEIEKRDYHKISMNQRSLIDITALINVLIKFYQKLTVKIGLPKLFSISLKGQMCNKNLTCGFCESAEQSNRNYFIASI